MVFETFHEILLQYNDILLQTSQCAYHYPTSYCLGKNKFEEVRKDLFEFLYIHKDFIKLKAIVFKSTETNISKKILFYYLDDASKLIDINSYLKVIRKLKMNSDVTTIENFKTNYSIKLVIIYNRKNTLRALKNFFKVEEHSERSIVNLSGNYFIGNKIFPITYKTASYKKLLENLTDYYSELCINVKLMEYIIDVINVYIRFLCEITEIDINSNNYLLHVRKFDEVLKEFYEFAVAHKSIIKLKNAHIIQPLKRKTNFAKVDFDYSKKGLNFLNFNSLKELQVLSNSWSKINELIFYDCSFDFNNQNLKKVISSSITKSVNSVEELKNLCYDTFLRKTKAQNNKIRSPYKELMKDVRKRFEAFYEGKVSCEYFNQLCSTYEGSTDENGEMLKCSICLGELEIGAEVCRLPCGHLNCKTCIEGWFDIKTKFSDKYVTSDEDDYETSVEKDNDTLIEDYYGTSVGKDNYTSIKDDKDTSVKDIGDTLVEQKIKTLDENDTASDTNDKETLDEYQVETLDENNTASDKNFNGTPNEYQVETLDKDEKKNSGEDLSDDSKALDGNSDDALASNSEASTLEKDTSSNLVGSPVIVDNDTPSSDVYWNEYVVDDNEKQKARNQCPTCKHICS